MRKLKFNFPDLPVIWWLMFLNIFAVIFYFLILDGIGYWGHVNDILFSTSDSQEYREYINWLKGLSDYCNPNRPFFYPLLLLIARTLGGLTGIWIMQFLFWLIACNLSFLSVRKLGVGKVWAAISFLLIATYLSSISLTAHGLTEITVLFFFSMLTYIFSSNINELRAPAFGLKLVLLFSILFAIKPFYQIHLIICILIFIVFHFKNLIKRPLLFLFFIFCLSPAIIQYSINKIKHGVLNSDILAEQNFKYYFFNKVDYVAETHDLEKFNYLGDSIYAIRHKNIEQKTATEIRSFLVSHPLETFSVFTDDLYLNIVGTDPYIDAEKHPELNGEVWKMNGRYYDLHKYMALSIFLFFLITIRKKKTAFHFWILALSFCSFSILFVTGITFWAGDRLVIPSIAVWSVIYPVFISYVLKELFLTEHAFFRKKFTAIYNWRNKQDH